jgi:hypothetical protein
MESSDNPLQVTTTLFVKGRKRLQIGGPYDRGACRLLGLLLLIFCHALL